MPESFVAMPADSTGKKMRAFERVVGGNTVYETFTHLAEEATWYYTTPSIAGAANRIFFAFVNTTAGQKISLRGLWLIRDNTAVTTPTRVQFDLKKISAVVGGTAVTANIMDTTDGALSGVTAVHTATSATEGAVLLPWYGSSEESLAAQVVATDNMYTAMTNFIPVVPAMKTPRFNNGEGFCLKASATTATGSWVVVAAVSKED